jgi:hypothetical protein
LCARAFLLVSVKHVGLTARKAVSKRNFS